MNRKHLVQVIQWSLLSTLIVAPAVTWAAGEQDRGRLAELRVKNQRASDEFLAENKTREGVIALPSGLQYKILRAGDGKKPEPDDTVMCHFRGTRLDGTEFVTTHAAGRPSSVNLKTAIKGWAEAIQLMPVGSKWQLFVPPHLAYGDRGLSQRVGPGAAVMFEVELLSIDNALSRAAKEIKVMFKLDPRLTQGLYMGERWVSPPRYSKAGADETLTIESRAAVVDQTGRPTNAALKWIVDDPQQLTVTPDQGNAVAILVRRPGQSKLRLMAAGISKELAVTARKSEGTLQVEISQ